ncbi:hypothetical protein EON63_03620 [archaeon]|nr:MAG: hypothetical protein EON63_03620 [archaeon]
MYSMESHTRKLQWCVCTIGLAKAKEHKFFDFARFNIEEYEHYEQVENGDLNWYVYVYMAVMLWLCIYLHVCECISFIAIVYTNTYTLIHTLISIPIPILISKPIHIHHTSYHTYARYMEGRFLGFAGPHAERECSPGGYYTLRPDDYIPYFKRKNVTLVVRLNKSYYDPKKFTSQVCVWFTVYGVYGV